MVSFRPTRTVRIDLNARHHELLRRIAKQSRADGSMRAFTKGLLVRALEEYEKQHAKPLRIDEGHEGTVGH